MLTTKENVKRYLGLTDSDSDSNIEMLIGIVDSHIKSRCGCNIEKKTYTEKSVPADGVEKTFYLPERPIEENSLSVEYDGVEYSSDRYEVDYETGKIVFDFAPPKSLNKLKVTYTGGYETLPDDIKGMATIITAELFRSSGGGKESGEISSEKLGDYQVTYKIPENAGNDIDKLADRFVSIMNKYRVITI